VSGEVARRAGARAYAGLRTELIADGLVDVDYLPEPSTPSTARANGTERAQLVPHAGGALLIRAELLDAIAEDLRRQVERARGEYALLATEPSPAAAVGKARERQWRAMYPALAQLLDHSIGGPR